MMILLGKNVFTTVDLDEIFSQRHWKKNYKPQNEREINEYFLNSLPDLWALMWAAADLETSE